MARLLHITEHDRGRSYRLSTVALGIVLTVVMSGCFVPPELPRDPNEPVPPHIVEAEPPQRFLDITSTNEVLTFGVDVEDPNEHRRIYYALLSDQRGFTQLGSETDGGTPGTYEINIPDIELCTDVPPGRIETFTLYIADRQFRNVSVTNPEPPPLVLFEGEEEPGEGHRISRSWILNYTDSACN
jgi:hypothetical protein